MCPDVLTIEKQDTLDSWLASEENEGKSVKTTLSASNRVIARVTDGIYREPYAALRELISNAWDADAQNVSILTDAPRFSQIIIRDDGLGMSHQTLSRLIKNIGGSAKRTEIGQKLGIVSPDSLFQTPSGRPLIGKIGIGLFSISQLARRFRIITKVENTNYRLVAQIIVNNYDDSASDDGNHEDDDTYVSGEVLITKLPADDVKSHGTDIIIEDVKPAVRNLLRSAERWELLEEKTKAQAQGDLDTVQSIKAEAPIYHTGWIKKINLKNQETTVQAIEPKLPWIPKDPANSRMQRLVDAVRDTFSESLRPDLVNTLDSYLVMIWMLALSAPVPYLKCHPFDLKGSSGVRLFWLSNQARTAAKELAFDEDKTVREVVREQVEGHPELTDGADCQLPFNVNVDGVDLRRPITFDFIPASGRGSQDKAMLFVGKLDQDLSKITKAKGNERFSLEGYLFWNGRIVPKENNGVLVRIKGSSGALFDSGFFKYQVSEQTRLRQITSELFVHHGLDAALHIDRESFNFSHSHIVLTTHWFHRAIRQLTNRHKEDSSKTRQAKKSEEMASVRSAVALKADRVWQQRNLFDPPPEIVIAAGPLEALSAQREGALVLNTHALDVLREAPTDDRQQREALAKGLLQVLAAYDRLEGLSPAEQQSLINDIISLFLEVASK